MNDCTITCFLSVLFKCKIHLLRVSRFNRFSTEAAYFDMTKSNDLVLWQGRKGKCRKGKERKGKERKGKERKGKERKGKERKGKERKGKEKKGKEKGSTL